MITRVIDRIIAYINSNEKQRKLNSLVLFRMLFFTHIFFKIYYTHLYKGLIFDSIAGITKNPFPINTYLIVWSVTAFMMLIGWCSKYASVINYICVVIAYQLFWRSGIISYYDDLLLLVSLLCIFLPVSKSGSVDALIRRVTTGSTKPVYTSQLVYATFILLSLGFVYFGSGISKLASPIWQNGIGLWIPMSTPSFKWNTLSNHFADWEWLMKSLNYLIIAWEIFFIPMLLHKQLRKLAIMLGIVFHIGIAVFLYFPFIALATLLFYSLFIPDSFWNYLSNKLETSTKITVYIPADSLLAVRAWIFLKSIDYRNRFVASDEQSGSISLSSAKSFNTLLGTYLLFAPVAYFLQSGAHRGVQRILKKALSPSLHIQQSFLTYTFKRSVLIHFVLFICCLQCYISAKHVYKRMTQPLNTVVQSEQKTTASGIINPASIIRSAFGINGRGLFLDNAIATNRTVFAITYYPAGSSQLEWLPFVTPKGYVTNDFNTEGAWSKPYTHYIAKRNQLSVSGLEKAICFWGTKYHQPVRYMNFIILKRSYFPPQQFETGYWRKTEDLPWDTIGTARWENNVFRYTSVNQDTISIK